MPAFRRKEEEVLYYLRIAGYLPRVYESLDDVGGYLEPKFAEIARGDKNPSLGHIVCGRCAEAAWLLTKSGHVEDAVWVWNQGVEHDTQRIQLDSATLVRRSQ